MTVASRSPQELWVCHLGTIPYRDALATQERLRAERQADQLPDMLLLLEHPPTYTHGRRSRAQDLPFPEGFYRAKGIDVHSTQRGGKVTYHGPGQLVGYPIMRIHDVHRYLRTMESAIIDALADAGVTARSRHQEGIDYTGVWVGDRKIASIGVHVSRGVATHGFAINVHNDLQPFSWVIACGLPDVTMTSLARELAGTPATCTPAAGTPSAGTPSAGTQGAGTKGAGTPAAPDVTSDPHTPPASATCWPSSDRSLLACTRKRIAHAFCQAHDRRQRLVSPQRLGIHTTNPSRLAERVPINTNQHPPVAAGAAIEAVPT